MKTKLLFATAVLVALIAPVPANASDRIPAKFIGDWCAPTTDDAGSRYKRGSCREVGDGFEIHTDGFRMNGGETYCKVLRVTHVGNGDYLVRARCTTEDDPPRNNHFFMSINRDAVSNPKCNRAA